MRLRNVQSNPLLMHTDALLGNGQRALVLLGEASFLNMIMAQIEDAGVGKQVWPPKEPPGDNPHPESKTAHMRYVDSTVVPSAVLMAWIKAYLDGPYIDGGMLLVDFLRNAREAMADGSTQEE